MKLSLDALTLLDTIEHYGSFAAAAKVLHKVPSAISYQVQKLESDLNITIFERKGPKVSMTHMGSQLLNEGRILLKAAQELENRIQHIAAGWEPELKIGLSEAFSLNSLQGLIKRFQATQMPTVIRLRREVLLGTWESLLDQRTDLFIGLSKEHLPPHDQFDYYHLGEMHFRFVVAPHHPLAHIDGVISDETLLKHHAIVLADSVQHMPSKTLGVLNGQASIVVPDIMTKLDYQLNGLGFGFLPDFTVDGLIKNGQFVEKKVNLPSFKENIYMAWNKRHQGNAMQWWLKTLQAQDLFSLLCEHSAQQINKYYIESA